MVKPRLNKNGTVDRRTKEYKAKEMRKNLKARYVNESELSDESEESSESESEISESEESELSSEVSSDSSLPKKKSGLRKGFKGYKRK